MSESDTTLGQNSLSVKGLLLKESIPSLGRHFFSSNQLIFRMGLVYKQEVTKDISLVKSGEKCAIPQKTRWGAYLLLKACISRVFVLLENVPITKMFICPTASKGEGAEVIHPLYLGPVYERRSSFLSFRRLNFPEATPRLYHIAG